VGVGFFRGNLALVLGNQPPRTIDGVVALAGNGIPVFSWPAATTSAMSYASLLPPVRAIPSARTLATPPPVLPILFRESRGFFPVARLLSCLHGRVVDAWSRVFPMSRLGAGDVRGID